MKKLKILVIWCLVLSLMFSLGMTTVGLAEDAQESGQENEGVKRLHEVTELREKSSKTYLLEDGTYQFVGHAEDIHYIDDSGEYVDIDNSISSSAKGDYTFSNTANSWYTHFGDSLDQKGAVVMEKDDYSISFSLAEAANITSVQKSSSLDKSDSVFDEHLSSDNRTVVYKDVYDNVDIAYTVRTGGLKEDIILRSNNAPNKYEFNIELNGLTIVDRDGFTYFVNDKGEDVFRLEPMYMEDANEKFSDKVYYSIEEQEGGYSLTVTADEDFLTAQDTVYPVVIDPSVMVTGSSDTWDSCVDQQYPTSNYYLSENLWTGGEYNTNAMRTYMKFDLPTNIHADIVTSAYLRIKKKDYETPGIKAYRVISSWTSSNITWNNRPGFTTTYGSTTAYNDTGDWYRMYTTTNVKYWLDGTYNNYGFVLKEPSETDEDQKTKFYSSDAPSPNKPELIIVYDDTNMLDYWESDEDTIRRWSSTPSYYRTKLNSDASFYFWTAESHARTQWANASIPTTYTSSEASADIIIYGGTYYEIIAESDLFDGYISVDTVALCRAGRSYEKDYYYNQSVKAGYTMVYAYIAVLDQGYSVTNQKMIVTHELGHGLGWAGHASASTNIMHESVNAVTTLTVVDKRHLQQVY